MSYIKNKLQEMIKKENPDSYSHGPSLKLDLFEVIVNDYSIYEGFGKKFIKALYGKEDVQRFCIESMHPDIVDNIISDIIDDNLDNYITIKIKTDLTGSDYSQYMKSLTYKLFDETIERKLTVGDYLTNSNSKP